MRQPISEDVELNNEQLSESLGGSLPKARTRQVFWTKERRASFN
jgi:hypothetical protein